MRNYCNLVWEFYVFSVLLCWARLFGCPSSVRFDIAHWLLKPHPEPENRSHRNFCFKTPLVCSIRLYSGDFGGRKISSCEYFPARFCKTSFLWNAALSMMMIWSFGSFFNNFSSNLSSTTAAFIDPLLVCGASTVPSRCAATSPIRAWRLPLMRIFRLSPRLLYAYWRYICVLKTVLSIICEPFLGMSLIFFSNMVSLFGGLFFVKRTLFRKI